jgi:predicted O-methyltransferase YrrM
MGTEGTQIRTANTAKVPKRPALGLRREVRGLLRGLWFAAFRLFEKLGVHVLPANFYTSVQNYHWLKAHKQFWTARSPLIGINWEIDRQLAWVNEICAPYYSEIQGLKFFNETAKQRWGQGFGRIESQVLHCFVRSKAPARVVEIGSGQSTVCMLHASKLNANEGRPASEVTCIEPYPREALRRLQGARLLHQSCQTVPGSVFSQLREGDLLFIDSSHAVKVGSDVIRIYMEIVPSLAPGVFVHIHDINFPYLYNRSILSSFFMQNSQEGVLLAAMLSGNTRLSVLASLSALHYDRPREMQRVLKDYEPQDNVEGMWASYPPPGDFPSSIWLETR